MDVLQPVFYLLRLRRSPAYRLVSADARGTALRAALATVLTLVMGGCALLSSYAFVEQSHIPEVLVQVVPAALWRFVFEWNFHFAWVPLTAGLISGLMAFAPERRAGTMEQLVLLNLSGGEIILARGLWAFLPVLPAIPVGPVVYALLLPTADRIGPESVNMFLVADALLFAAAWGLWLLSGVVLTVALGVLCSLRTDFWKRVAAFALVAALLSLELRFWGFHPGAWAVVLLGAFAAVHFFMAAKALIFAGRHFDLLALGVGLDPGARGAGPRA